MLSVISRLQAEKRHRIYERCRDSLLGAIPVVQYACRNNVEIVRSQGGSCEARFIALVGGLFINFTNFRAQLQARIKYESVIISSKHNVKRSRMLLVHESGTVGYI